MLKIIFWIITIIALSFILLRFFVIPKSSPLPSSITSPEAEQANHTLSPCPDSPNCVSSSATKNSQKVEPFSFEGSGKDAINKLKEISTNLGNSSVVSHQDNYLHVTFKSPLMGYIDDTEFVADDTTGLIQVRSAARLGKSDLNKNKERVEAIRKEFQ